MFNETMAKLKTYRDEKLQRLKSLKTSHNFSQIIHEKRNTLKVTFSQWSAQTKFPQPTFPNLREVQKKALDILPKPAIASEAPAKIRAVISKTSFPRKKTFRYAAAFGITAFLIYEFIPHRTKIVLSYKNTPENSALVSRLSYLKDRHFYPTFYIFGALLQSIMNGVIVPHVNFQREYLKLQDGGTIALDWADPFRKVENANGSSKYVEVPADETTPTIFVIHGLTGGSNTGYIRGLVTRAQKRGFRVVVFQHRGVNQPLSTPLPYHGGLLDDISFAIDHVKAKYPNAKLLAVGNSLGGNQLLRYLAQTGEDCPFESAVALGSPWDVNNCVDEMAGTVYEKFFIKKYTKNTVDCHRNVLGELTKTHGIDLDHVMATNTLRSFHDSLTVKVYNYKDSYELFGTLLVTKEMIQNIKVPTLVLHAKDDPIVTVKDIPKEEISKNNNIILAETSRGAHICWFTGLKPKRVTQIFF